MNQTRELVSQKTTRIFYNILHIFVTAKPAEQNVCFQTTVYFLKASKKKTNITISKFRDKIPVYSRKISCCFDKKKLLGKGGAA